MFYLKRYPLDLCLFVLVSAIYAAILAATGFVYAQLTAAAMSGNAEIFMRVALLALAFFLLDTLFDYLPRYLKYRLVNRVLDTVRKDLALSYLRADLQTIDEKESTERTNILVNWLDVLENQYLLSILSMMTSALVFLFSLAGAIYLQSLMTLIMLLLCFIPFLAPLINQKLLSSITQERQKAKKAYLTLFEDYSRNLLFIRVSNISKIFLRKLAQASRLVLHRSNRFVNKQSQTYAISYGLSNIVYSGAWIVGGIFVFLGSLTITDLIAMTTLMGTVAGPIQSISEIFTDYLSSRGVVADLTAQLTSNQEKQAGGQIALTASINSLELRQVSYAPAQKPVFEQFSYQFKDNQKYVITGKSGSGKTTLLRLLLGIQEPQAGQVLVNHQALSNVNQASYFDKLAYLPQKTAIFKATIAENVTLFREVDESRLIDCLEQVGLGQWLSKQENGIWSQISSDKQLSGGEERRLDFARALYKEADVLLLDEPTTGLDSKTELTIGQLISSMDGKIIIVVSHSTNQEFLALFDERIILSH